MELCTPALSLTITLCLSFLDVIRAAMLPKEQRMYMRCMYVCECKHVYVYLRWLG